MRSLSLSLSLRSRQQSLCYGFTAAKFIWWTVKSGTEDAIAKSHFFGTGSRPSCTFLTLLLLFINTPSHTRARFGKKTHGHVTCRNAPANSQIAPREMKRAGREDSGISAAVFYRDIRPPKAFYSRLACSRAHACAYNDTNTPEPAVCVSCFCVCVTWFYILLSCLIRQCWRRTRRLA